MKYKCKMVRALMALFVVVAACLYGTLVQSQVIPECTTETQCSKGYYCDALRCHKCLRCEDFKRESLLPPSVCIKSVVDCGPCIEGLGEEHGGDSSWQCVPETQGAGGGGPPAYVWVAVAVGLLLLALVVLIVVYVLRNTYTFKILASTRTSVQSACRRSNGATAGASAPDLPPPYDATYQEPYNPIPASPEPHPPPPLQPLTTDNVESQPHEEDSSWLVMKRRPSERGARAREAAGRQAARVYNYPRYVRAPNTPSSYESQAMSDEPEPAFTVHDEDTMESTWTPSPSVDHTDTNGNASSGPTSALVPVNVLAVPHSSHMSHAPHVSHASHAPHEPHVPHAHCARQDTNNNRNASETNVSGGQSFIINVVQNINAVKQHNDVTL